MATTYKIRSFGANVTLMEAKKFLAGDVSTPAGSESVYNVFKIIDDLGAMDMFVSTLGHYADNHNILMAGERYAFGEYLQNGNHVTVSVKDASPNPRNKRQCWGYMYLIRVTVY